MKTCCDELIELIALAVIVVTLTAGWSFRTVRREIIPTRAPAVTFVSAPVLPVH